MANLDTNTLC